uniref:HMG box domain-containing protein n=1 Tax=Caenorhabditis japonica TaxID=281687 RepID=A0A8R1IMM2_CAEJA
MLNHAMRMPSYLPPGMMPHQSSSGEPRRTQGGGKVKKEDHIKKPLNAFMWFMKENRKKLLEEIGNHEKQSAELNKELGKRWHDLPKEEQQKYFEMAKKDREDHKEKYPQWSARENYAVNKKKTKKRRDKSI